MATAGFILSLAAIIPPLWLAISFANNPDGWFGGSGLLLSTAASTALFVTLIVAPCEFVLLTSAFVFSLLAIARSKTSTRRFSGLGIAGLTISVVAALLLVRVVVTAWDKAG